MAVVTFSTLKGKPVLDRGARRVGVVADVELDTERWQIEALVVGIDRDMLDVLGIARPLFGRPKIRIDMHVIRSAADSVLLNLDVSTLATALSTHGH